LGFKTERELLDMAIASPYMQEIIDAEIDDAFLQVEPRGLFGIPDLVIAKKENENQGCNLTTFAFEMKLNNWQRALTQAFRYRSFANMSYVMLDDDHVGPALTNIHKFVTSNIGLLSINTEGKINTHFEPNYDEPYSDQLSLFWEQLVDKTDE